MEKDKGNKEDAASSTAADMEPFGKIRLNEGETLKSDYETIISLRNVHKTYLLGLEGVPALRGVSLSVKRGEFVCIYGTSGGGKTTLLNIIGTIDRPSKGELQLCGTHITQRTPDSTLSQLRLGKMGFVFQTFNLLSALTAVENVELPMILSGKLTKSERRKRATELLASVGMAKRMNHLPSQLSGGEQQRVTIARAMANDPELLLLDEPTGDLDSHNSAIAMSLLLDLNKKGITLVMVTHDVGLKYFADRVVWMRDGLVQRIEQVSPAQQRDCIAKLEDELSQEPKQAAVQVETEVRQPHDYEPFAFAQRKREQPRTLVALGLATPAIVQLTPTAHKGKQPEQEQARDEQQLPPQPAAETETKHGHRKHKHKHSRRHKADSSDEGTTAAATVWPDGNTPRGAEASEVRVP